MDAGILLPGAGLSPAHHLPLLNKGREGSETQTYPEAEKAEKAKNL